MSAAGERFKVTVYASSSDRIDPAHAVVAEELGLRIARQGWDLVWGGGRFGLMGPTRKQLETFAAVGTASALVDLARHATEFPVYRPVVPPPAAKPG